MGKAARDVDALLLTARKGGGRQRPQPLRDVQPCQQTRRPVPRLIVWPEGTVDYWIEEGYPAAWYSKNDPRTVRRMIAQTLGPKDIALVGATGLLFKGDTKLDAATNSVFAIDASGTILGRYDKAHLVPYGEYLPMRALTLRGLPSAAALVLDWPGARFASGPRASRPTT